MLERDPRRRYQTAAAVATAIGNVIAARPEPPRAAPIATPVNQVPVKLDAIDPQPGWPAAELVPAAHTDDPLIVHRTDKPRTSSWAWIAAACGLLALIAGGAAYWVSQQTTEKLVDQNASQRGTSIEPSPRVKATATRKLEQPAAENKPEPKLDRVVNNEQRPGTITPDASPELATEPELVPLPRVIVDARPVNPPKAAQKVDPPKDRRRQVPEGPALDQAEAGIRELYKDDYKKTKHSELTAFAERLLEQAGNVKDDPVARYVLLREAREVAARAADADLAYKAIEELANYFALDARKMKIAVLDRAVREAHTPERSLVLAETAKSLMEEAISDDQYTEALRLAKLAEASAYRSSDRALITWTATKRRDVESLQKAFNDLKQVRAILAEKPDDAEANLAMGRFLCLLKGDWAQGLPHLVQSSDERLLELARKELGGIGNADQEAELANAWRMLARKERGLARAQLLVHALTICQKLLPDLAGVGKLKVEKMVDEIEKDLPSEYLPLPPGARFKGRWLVPFANRSLREYIIDAKGNVDYARENFVDGNGKVVNPREVNRAAKVFKQGNDYMLDFDDGTLERLSLKNGILVVEHYDPKALYPKGRPSIVATSVRKP
jgi:hypothetical protein